MWIWPPMRIERGWTDTDALYLEIDCDSFVPAGSSDCRNQILTSIAGMQSPTATIHEGEGRLYVWDSHLQQNA